MQDVGCPAATQSCFSFNFVSLLSLTSPALCSTLFLSTICFYFLFISYVLFKCRQCGIFNCFVLFPECDFVGHSLSLNFLVNLPQKFFSDSWQWLCQQKYTLFSKQHSRLIMSPIRTNWLKISFKNVYENTCKLPARGHQVNNNPSLLSIWRKYLEEGEAVVSKTTGLRFIFSFHIFIKS